MSRKRYSEEFKREAVKQMIPPPVLSNQANTVRGETEKSSLDCD